MCLPTSAMIKDLKSQLISIMDTPIGTPAMAEIDRELTPILVELLTLDCLVQSSMYHHAFLQLVDWLVQPQRTLKEFNYVLGPLGHYVNVVMYEHFRKYIFDPLEDFPSYSSLNLGMAAAEALAIKCSVLEGGWEQAAWLVVQIMKISKFKCNPSKRLNVWMIHMIGDSDACPNPYLRIELMSMLWMVTLDMHNLTQAVEAVMSACSSLNFNFLSGSCYGKFSTFHINKLFGIFSELTGTGKNIHNDFFIGNGCVFEFGQKLAKQLNDVHTSRLSTTLYDVSSQCGLNPDKYREPRELRSLIALIEATAGYTRYRLKKIDGSIDYNYYDYPRDISHDEDKNYRYEMHIFKILIYNFRACYQMPQLTYPTAMLVMDVLEYRLNYYVFADDKYLFLSETERVLKKLLTDSGSVAIENSPIGREITSRYGGRLKRLKQNFGDLAYNLNLNTICSLLSQNYLQNVNMKRLINSTQDDIILHFVD